MKIGHLNIVQLKLVFFVSFQYVFEEDSNGSAYVVFIVVSVPFRCHLVQSIHLINFSVIYLYNYLIRN